MRIQLNKFMPARSFRSRVAFADEAQKQAEWFRRLQKMNPVAHQQWGNSLQGAWDTAYAVANDTNVPDENLSDVVSETPCIPHDSALVERMLWFTKNGLERRAEGVRGYLFPRADGNNGTRGYQAGAADAAAILAVQNRLGPSSTKKMVADLLDQFEASIDPILEKDKLELERKREEFADAKTQMEEALQRLESEARDFTQQRQADWDSTYSAFVEQLKTETAVKLWEDRAKVHQKRFQGFRWAVGISAILGGIVAFAWIFKGFQFAVASFPSNESAQLASFIAGSALIFTLLVWTLRVLVRSMMSEDHLSTDASARSAMAHTYLALSKDNQASDEDRAIILASLFAPVSDGLVKDDGMPLLSPAALAAAAITNPKTS